MGQQEVTAYTGRDQNDFWEAAITTEVAPIVEPLPPGQATHTYIFTLESFDILTTRSKHKDTVFVSAALRVGNQSFEPTVRQWAISTTDTTL
jgi:hypothetical protein